MEKYFNDINQDNFDATYSPEDNKLRIYAAERIDSEDYAYMKSKGFRWAPKQDLFFAHWSPQAEDICLKLAGDIGPEGMSLADRAEIKAARLDALAEKREEQAHSFAAAAKNISERFAYGQPILVGHHSERKARKDKQAMERNEELAHKALDAVNYWGQRAKGVERYANMKNDAGVRANRIQKLLKDLRDQQNIINHGHIVQDLWTQIQNIEDPEKQKKSAVYWAGGRLKTGSTTPDWELYSKCRDGEVTVEYVIEQGFKHANNMLTSQNVYRKLSHTLNRLAYEREQLGHIAPYLGKINAGVLQTFARAQGALKPKATATDHGWLLTSPVPLPLHISDSTDMELPEEEWRLVMYQAGYEVPEKKPAKPQILNFKHATLYARNLYNRHEVKKYTQIEMTQEQYRNLHGDNKYIQKSICGTFRFRVGIDVNEDKPGYMATRYAVFLTDAKTHPIPDSLTETKAA